MAAVDTYQDQDESAIQNSIDITRNLTLCKICLRPFYEPFVTACGHTFCYGCLRNWFCGNGQSRSSSKNCPECRSSVDMLPAPNFAIRDLAHMFVSRPELLAEGETITEHEEGMQEEARLLANDRAGKGLFKGIFSNRRHIPISFGFERPQAPIRDLEDGVERCPICTWELEDGYCSHCDWDTYAFDDDFDDEHLNYESGTGRNLGDEDSMGQSNTDDEGSSSAEDDEDGESLHGTGTSYHNWNVDYDDIEEEIDEDDMDAGSIADFISNDEELSDATESEIEAHERRHQRIHEAALRNGGRSNRFGPLNNNSSSFGGSRSPDQSSYRENVSSEQDDSDISLGIRLQSDEQTTNFDETSEGQSDTTETGQPPSSPVVRRPKRRAQIVISDDDDDDDDENDDEDTVRSSSSQNEVSPALTDEDLDLSQHGVDDSEHDSEDSTPPQPATRRRNRLQAHRSRQTASHEGRRQIQHVSLPRPTRHGSERQRGATASFGRGRERSHPSSARSRIH